jgi:hypothetical protein
MGSLFGVDINPSLDPFSGSYGESKSLGTTGPQLDPSKMTNDDYAAAVLSGGGIPGAMDKGLRDKYSWKGIYDQKIAEGKSDSEARKAAAAAEAARPKAKSQEGVIDYTKLQKTLKQMQGVKGKAINPDIMQSLLSGAITGQIQPAIAREERAMDRAIQQKQLDIEQERHKQALKVEEKTAEMGFVGDVLGAIGAATVLCTELNRQGLLDIQVIERANKYRRKHISKEVYEGYLMWATPLVEIMKASPLVTKIVCFFWKPLTYELASRGRRRKGSLLGKISYSVLSRFSKAVYFFNQKEVAKWVAQ